MLQFQWAAPLNFSVAWQWSLTFSSSSSSLLGKINEGIKKYHNWVSGKAKVGCAWNWHNEQGTFS